MGLYIKAFLIMLGFIIILFIASVVMKTIGSKYGNMGHSRYIKIVDRLIIGKDQQLYIIQVGYRIYFLGVTNNTIKTLGEFEQDDLIPIDSEQDIDFLDLFAKYKDMFCFRRGNGEGRDDEE